MALVAIVTHVTQLRAAISFSSGRHWRDLVAAAIWR